MDLESVFTYISEEALQGDLLIYVAIGCAVGRYPEGEHPAQQYPPYLQKFACRQICVLIDPMLEMPPRAMADVAKLPGDITILPVLQTFHHTGQEDECSLWFLDRLTQLCMDSSNCKMIVHEFTGININLYYPTHFGKNILTNVLYDPTYSDGGGCSPDLSTIQILCDQRGNFLQPNHSRLQDIYKTVPKHIFNRQFRMRQYPVIELLQRQYRILRNLEEPRDWLTEHVLQHPIHKFCFIYNIDTVDSLQQLRKILLAVIQDLCILSESYLTEEEGNTIADSAGKELETMWNSVGAILAA
jgi:hypothetical protein